MRCLPSSAFPLVVGATVIVMGWLGWASMRDPEALWAPGDLSRYHADVRKCSQCHERFRGAIRGIEDDETLVAESVVAAPRPDDPGDPGSAFSRSRSRRPGGGGPW